MLNGNHHLKQVKAPLLWWNWEEESEPSLKSPHSQKLPPLHHQFQSSVNSLKFTNLGNLPILQMKKYWSKQGQDTSQTVLVNCSKSKLGPLIPSSLTALLAAFMAPRAPVLEDVAAKLTMQVWKRVWLGEMVTKQDPVRERLSPYVMRLPACDSFFITSICRSF